MAECTHLDQISDVDPQTPSGCGECMKIGGTWLHLRLCLSCGEVNCCDSSPNQHATKHFESTGHPIMRSFEPGETWFWNYQTNEMGDGPELAAPDCHPESQPTPGPAGVVPSDWESKLNA